MAGVTSVAAAIAYALLLRPWHMTLGCTRAEADARLPGDELLDRPRLQATHAVAIRASPKEIWPWLVQIGQGRGGFYSYDALERLFGCGISNVYEVVPDLLRLRPGDAIALHVKAPPLTVVAIEPHRALVLAGGPDLQPGLIRDPSWYRLHTYQGYIWSFTLHEQADGSTRLVARIRVAWNRSHLGHFFRSRIFLEPVHTVMQRKMNRTIKALVEKRVAAERPLSLGGP